LAPELLLGVLAIVVALLVERIHKSWAVPRGLRAARAACGQCGYAFRGEPRCPECGQLVEQVGVLTPRLLLSLRPGLIAAGVYVGLLVLIVGIVGQRVGRANQGALGSLLGVPTFGANPSLVAGSMLVGFLDTRQPPGTRAAQMEIPVVLSIYFQLIEPSSVTGGVTTRPGEVILALHEFTRKVSPEPRGPERLSKQMAGVAFLRIDPVKRTVEAFDAAGKSVAVFPSIVPDAFDRLVEISAVASKEYPRELFTQHRDVLSIVERAIDEGMDGPAWGDLTAKGSKSLRRTHLSGSFMSRPAPANFMPAQPVWITLWPYLWWLGVVLAGVWLYVIVLRRRRRIMAVPAAKPLASM
jgi:hypothetical protein